MTKLLIAGAKGFARELLETVLQNDPAAEVIFFDDMSTDLPELLFGRFEVIRSIERVAEYFRDNDRSFALGVGSPVARKMFCEKFTALGGSLTTVISPHARIGTVENDLGEGVNVLTDAVIESGNQIGTGCLIHVGAFVSHEVRIGRFCEISPKASLLGNVSLGDLCRIGTGAVVLPGISIGDQATVGAGSVVTKDVADGTTVIGVPAKPIRSK